MNQGATNAMLEEPRVHVTALAEIVHELVTGGASRLRDGQWLHDRAVAAGLDMHERAALETLCGRLCDGGTALRDAIVQGLGTW